MDVIRSRKKESSPGPGPDYQQEVSPRLYYQLLNPLLSPSTEIIHL